MKPLVDLTMTIREGMTTYPSDCHPRVEITQLGRHHIEGRETRKLVMGTHTGTHIDAPSHFIPGGKTIDEIDQDLFIGECMVLNLVGMPQKTCVEMMGFIEFIKPKRLLLRYDWYKQLNSAVYYHDYCTIPLWRAKEFIAAGVRLLAMDTPSPENGNMYNDVHNEFLKNDVVLVEYLSNTEALGNVASIELYCLPLKIGGADGAPCRVLARPL